MALIASDCAAFRHASRARDEAGGWGRRGQRPVDSLRWQTTAVGHRTRNLGPANLHCVPRSLPPLFPTDNKDCSQSALTIAPNAYDQSIPKGFGPNITTLLCPRPQACSATAGSSLPWLCWQSGRSYWSECF